ncbi:MAG: YggS family pyridoxal phosphate-dependent enzyme [Candidatus Omnitrophica bacterium]|nr:YggS family pyridoxal phosphate-dependent enzyme [Candidatus Omnitrophota bacterium]MDE2010374.1 YggS family pyridoxal phosphate-dependent enzyme [Candidatus Omnitrophota bacterium]MDE2214868.1 YggS family pyridoxal phosphate-dependent enzyme [Candidatus Omnitrophota bacterium]MDE2230801.1 YggS family pyridoxal phosphate-dependent enzyme [Candidatus Omnitrophota bacterium]
MVRDNVQKILSEIEASCRKAGREAREVTLVGVTKTVGADVIQEAIGAGIKHIAENRVQEAENKFPSLLAKNPHIKTHIIGHLQTNKARDVIKVCSLLQSVDSLKLAFEIEKQAAKSGRVVDILVQFNTAHEEQKFGADPVQAQVLIEGISQLEHVRIKGLMCMAPYTEDQGIIRKTFSDLRGIRESIKTRFAGHPRVDMGILSMGMSGDYQIAIEEGSTMVRIGSAIFK